MSELELRIADKDLVIKLTRARTLPIPGGWGQVELEWYTKRALDHETIKDNQPVNCALVVERIKLASLEKTTRLVWLPDPPLPPARVVKVARLEAPPRA